MDVEESVNNFVYIYEFLVSDSDTFDEVLTVTFPSSNYDDDWLIAMNGHPISEREISLFPDKDKQVTIHPLQAMIFLGRDHVGIIGAFVGEFYDERFPSIDRALEDEFFKDFKTEFV